MNRWTVIVSGGMLEEEFARSVLENPEIEFIIGVDRGLEFLYRHEICPNYIVGDFDSVSGEILGYYEKETKVPIRKFNPVKDASDTEIALRLCLDLGRKNILILGATGNRIDHIWANVQCLKIGLDAGADVRIVDSRNRIRLLDREITLSKKEAYGPYFSVFPLGKSVEKFNIEGAKYPLKNHKLTAYDTKKITPAAIEFVDIAGLVKGASKGEGLGNQFLANIREVDAIVHVVRCFEDSNIVHVDGSIDPLRDIETINLELIFSDLEILERRIAKVVKLSRNDKTAAKELELLKRIKEHLEENKMAKSFTTDDEEEQEWLTSYNLLTYKPVIFAANVTEDDLANDGADNAGVQKVREYAAEENCEVFVVCAQIEQEIAELDEDEKKLFLDDLGLEESGLEKLIKASYHLLGLISYLTAGEQECRAWTITKGTKAPQAAGKIHTDFERGFIRAEVVSYDDLMACGTHAAAKEKGLVRLEGKEYVVQDGDIIVFRFNV